MKDVKIRFLSQTWQESNEEIQTIERNFQLTLEDRHDKIRFLSQTAQENRQKRDSKS